MSDNLLKRSLVSRPSQSRYISFHRKILVSKDGSVVIFFVKQDVRRKIPGISGQAFGDDLRFPRIEPR